MSDITAWDQILEEATPILEQLTSGKLRGRVLLQTESGWGAEIGAHGRTVSLQFARPGGTVQLDDYQLVLIYGCDFRPLGDEGRPKGWAKVLNLQEGYHWDEQTLRETVLELLGIFRHVLGIDGSTARMVDATRVHAGPLRIATGRAHKKK
jgi:hypothetical protein